MTPEEEADVRRTIERLYAEKDQLRQNQCLICEHPADHDQQLCVARLERAEAERDKLRAELQQTCSAAYDETARLRAERDRLQEELDGVHRAWRSEGSSHHTTIAERDEAYAQRDDNWRRLCEANTEIARLREEMMDARYVTNEEHVFSILDHALSQPPDEQEGWRSFQNPSYISPTEPPNEQGRRPPLQCHGTAAHTPRCIAGIEKCH